MHVASEICGRTALQGQLQQARRLLEAKDAESARLKADISRVEDKLSQADALKKAAGALLCASTQTL
jgi:hypothetical protein